MPVKQHRLTGIVIKGEHGGHTPLEAAAWEVPVVTGPWMFNFEEISGLLCEAGAMLRLDDPVELADALLDLLGDASRRRRWKSSWW